jgi:hypothetical protein
MTAWSADELATIDGAEELRIASRRDDGSLRNFITIWVVRVDDGIYVRSAYGWDNPWFQRALRSGQGRIRAGGLERDVAFEQREPETTASVTAAYHAKYERYGPRMVGTVVSPDAERSTLRIRPV